MKRLLVLAALSTLGTGCVVSDECDARTVSIGWPSFRLANGTVTSSCGTAAVSTVQVFMDDAPVGTFACIDGGVNVTGVLNDGDHLFTVEAIDSSSGNIALRDEFTIGNSNCSNPLVDTQPSEGTFVLDYRFDPNVCSSGTASYIWFTIHDDISGDTIAVDSASTPQAYTCGDGTGGTTPVPITFPLASGSYTLQRTEEILYDPGPIQVAGNCNDTSFNVTGASQATLQVLLADGVACF